LRQKTVEVEEELLQAVRRASEVPASEEYPGWAKDALALVTGSGFNVDRHKPVDDDPEPVFFLQNSGFGVIVSRNLDVSGLEPIAVQDHGRQGAAKYAQALCERAFGGVVLLAEEHLAIAQVRDTIFCFADLGAIQNINR